MDNLVKKVLIIAPTWIGDLVMAQTLFKILKQNNPNIVIDVIAHKWSIDLLNRMPEVNKSILQPVVSGQLKLGLRYKHGLELRESNYDQAIILPNSHKSALIPLFAKIPIRTGWLGEMRFGVLNDYRYLNKNKYKKMIQRFAALAYPCNYPLSQELPLPKLNINPKNIELLKNKFNLDLNKKIIAIAPGAAFGSAKRWPAEYYAKLAIEKIKSGYQVWIFGSKGELDITTNIKQSVNNNNNCINFAGKTSLSDTVDLLSLIDMAVMNDSGLMHITASLNKKLIVIYGPTSSEFTPPLGKNSEIVKLNLPCQPCAKRECPLQHHNCMRKITPEIILDKLCES